MNSSISDKGTSSMGWRILARRGPQHLYALRLARGVADIQAAQALRFEVFNLEMNEGLDESYLSGLDADRFDEVCDHLLVEHVPSGTIVGTYRLQTGALAATRYGYYSASEFDFTPFEPWRHEILELGRACVHAKHRNIAVLGTLWQGIAAYARERDCRLLIGCSSLTSTDPCDGASLYCHLVRHHLAPLEFRTQPLPGSACALDHLNIERPRVPKLLAAYLSVGAKICAPPAIDPQFKTIDFLTLLDLDTLAPAAFGLIC